jgi:hypothetical protein
VTDDTLANDENLESETETVTFKMTGRKINSANKKKYKQSKYFENVSPSMSTQRILPSNQMHYG